MKRKSGATYRREAKLRKSETEKMSKSFKNYFTNTCTTHQDSPAQVASVDCDCTHQDSPAQVASFDGAPTRQDSTAQSKGDSTSVSSGASCLPMSPYKPFQPNTYPFPRRLFGKKERSFNSDWFSAYKWLHYDTVNDCAFCHVCMHQHKLQNITNVHNKEDAFI